MMLCGRTPPCPRSATKGVSRERPVRLRAGGVDATELEEMTRYRDRWKLKAMTLRGELEDLRHTYNEAVENFWAADRERERREVEP